MRGTQTVILERAGKHYEITCFLLDLISTHLTTDHKFYEHELLEKIASLNLKGVYVDVGAHIGNHSMFFANCCPATKVISLEPNPDTFKVLQLNQKRSPIEHVVMNIAAGDRPGTISINDFDARNSGATVVMMGEDIPIMPLDHVLDFDNNANPDVAFIKMDVEGMEYKALLGAVNTISTCHPAITTECWKEAELAKIRTFLGGMGYKEAGKYCLSPTYLWIWDNSTRPT
jgi:FkbM family methyltransferase